MAQLERFDCVSELVEPLPDIDGGWSWERESEAAQRARDERERRSDRPTGDEAREG